MKLSDLQNAYPAFPQSSLDRLVRTARSVSAYNDKPKKYLPKGLVIACVLLLLMISVAYAAVRLGILDYLVYQSNPSAELRASAQAVSAHSEADGIALTVTGAMYDGERLALSYTVENQKPENPAIFRIQSITLGGVPLWIDFAYPDNDWIPWAFGMQELSWSRNPVNGGMKSDTISESFHGKQEIVIQYTVERPLRPLVAVDAELLEPLENIAEEEMRAEKKALIDSILACGVTIADAQHQDAEWWNAQGYGVVDRTGYFYWPEIEYTEAMTEQEYDALQDEAYSIWSQEAQMAETGQETLRITIDADQGLEYRKEYVFLDKGADQREVILPDCMIRLERFTMTPLSTSLKFFMIPPENTPGAAEELRLKYWWLELRDENGQELKLAPMEYECSNGSLCQDESGQWMVEWDWRLPGAIEFPEEIHITARADIAPEKSPTAQQERDFERFAEKMRFRLKEK